MDTENKEVVEAENTDKPKGNVMISKPYILTINGSIHVLVKNTSIHTNIKKYVTRAMCIPECHKSSKLQTGTFIELRPSFIGFVETGRDIIVSLGNAVTVSWEPAAWHEGLQRWYRVSENPDKYYDQPNE